MLTNRTKSSWSPAAPEITSGSRLSTSMRWSGLRNCTCLRYCELNDCCCTGAGASIVTFTCWSASVNVVCPMTKCSPGGQRAAIDLLAAEKQRVSGVGQPDDFQPVAVPQQSDVAARDVVVPGHGPDAAQPAQHDRLVRPAASAASVVALRCLGRSGRAWEERD